MAESLNDAGYVSVTASSGALGLRVLEAEVRIDLLVIDLSLAGALNGWELIEAARLVRPDMKILVTIASVDHTIISRVRLAGIELLIMPFTMVTFATTVSRMVRATDCRQV
jgi:CheY-like chemotaxis protein